MNKNNLLLITPVIIIIILLGILLYQSFARPSLPSVPDNFEGTIETHGEMPEEFKNGRLPEKGEVYFIPEK